MKRMIFILLIATSCSGIKKSDTESSSPDTINKVLASKLPPDSSFQEPIDSLFFNSVKINNKIPLNLSEKELIKKLGHPDSIIIEHGWDCGNYINDLDSVSV
jgi:hypothetical protein